MAGHLGNQSATVLNLRVARIDQAKSLVYLIGGTPGAIGGLVRLRDACKKTDKQLWNLEYPTCLSQSKEDVMTWDGGDMDPYEQFFHENDVVSGNKDDGGD